MDSRSIVGRNRGTKLSFEGEAGRSRTEQYHADGTRVDQILRKYATHGIDANNVGLFRRAHVPAPQYGIQQDFDYQTQLNTIIKIQDYFSTLPARTRELFRNDPGNMLQFLSDPRNRDQAIKLGLLPKDKVAEGSAREPEKKPVVEAGDKKA